MTEATLDAFRSSPAPAAGVPPRAFNGAALRFTPGPDELRLPSSEEEPVPSNTRQAVAIKEGFGSLRLHFRGRRDVFLARTSSSIGTRPTTRRRSAAIRRRRRTCMWRSTWSTGTATRM